MTGSPVSDGRGSALPRAAIALLAACLVVTVVGGFDPDLPHRYVYVETWGSGGTDNGQLEYPQGVAVDAGGNVYVADCFNSRVQKFSSTGDFITLLEGPDGDDSFVQPQDIAIDATGNVFVVDNFRVRRFSSAGVFITKWGGYPETVEDERLNYPQGIAVDRSGNVYVADSGNDCIKKYSSTGSFITNWGISGSDDMEFDSPTDVAVDSAGNVYVTDEMNNRVQKFGSNGAFITKWGTDGTGDGQFLGPRSVVVDNQDRVYIADWGSGIQKFTSTGSLLTRTDDGKFSYLGGIAVDGTWNVYVTDAMGDQILKYSPENVAPVASFTASTTVGMAPLTVTFTDTSTNLPSSWLWDFGDGTTATSRNPVHTFTEIGEYSVRLTATSAVGSNSTTQPIEAFRYFPHTETDPPDGAHISLNAFINTTVGEWGYWSETTIRDRIILYRADGTKITTYTTPVVHQSYRYDEFGNVITTEIGFDRLYSGLQPDTTYNLYYNGNVIARYTTGQAAPVASFNAVPASGTAPLSVQFTDTSINAPTSWTWTFGDGGTSTLRNPSHTYTTASTYTARLTATNGAGSSSTTKTITVTGDTTPPASVTDLHVVTKTATSITWAWTDPVDIDFAKVRITERGVFKGYVAKGVQSYTLTGLTPNTGYTLGTRTFDSTGNSNATVVSSFVRTDPVTDTMPPASVTDLRVTARTATSITWAWADPTDADFAKVRITEKGVFKGYVAKGVKTYTLAGLTPNTGYTLGTRTVDGTGNSNATIVSNFARTASDDTTPPASVTDLHVVSKTATAITWAWTDPADTDFAKVRITERGVFQGYVARGIQSYTLTGLTPNTGYTLGTRTYDTTGNSNATIVSSFARTDPVTDTTPPASVTDLHVVSKTATAITWAWTDPTDADFAKVRITERGVFKGYVAKGVQTYTLTGLTPDTGYTLGTRTYDASGNGNATIVSNFARTEPLPSSLAARVAEPTSTISSASGKMTATVDIDSDADTTVATTPVEPQTLQVRTPGPRQRSER